uniref:(northern house mosquito) hypothetical protein n=1 Tax=Culex pipiens TaxID=7175 RepID=A0A8D8GG32_CULPI
MMVITLLTRLIQTTKRTTLQRETPKTCVESVVTTVSCSRTSSVRRSTRSPKDIQRSVRSCRLKSATTFRCKTQSMEPSSTGSVASEVPETTSACGWASRWTSFRTTIATGSPG